MSDGHLSLGLLSSITGSHWASWRHPDAQPERATDLSYHIALARAAERGLLDFVFLADGLALFEGSDADQTRFQNILMQAQPKRLLEPLTLLSALAVATERIGLIATVSTLYNEPYGVARALASLDHISDGRTGWNVVTSANIAEGYNFGRELLPHDQRYSRAREFVAIVTALWDSIGDDALIRDKAMGAYMDADKLHVLNHRGDHFSVRGPLNVPRPPQGRPVIAQAGSSEEGRSLAAESAEIVFTAQSQLQPAKDFYADIKQRVRDCGRTDTVRIMPGIVPYIGTTLAEAAAKARQLEALIPIDYALYMLSGRLGGVDLTSFPIDGSLPSALPDVAGSKIRGQTLVNMAREEGLSIRQLAIRCATVSTHKTLIGTPQSIVDEMEEWFAGDAADGFIVMPPLLPTGLDDLVDGVIPELQRRGLFRDHYEGRTLREHLNLTRPASRHAADVMQGAATGS